jgi:hypothetical protein
MSLLILTRPGGGIPGMRTSTEAVLELTSSIRTQLRTSLTLQWTIFELVMLIGRYAVINHVNARKERLHEVMRCMVTVSQSDWSQFPDCFPLGERFCVTGRRVDAMPSRRATEMS